LPQHSALNERVDSINVALTAVQALPECPKARHGAGSQETVQQIVQHDVRVFALDYQLLICWLLDG
jgi:hypothetical protein